MQMMMPAAPTQLALPPATTPSSLPTPSLPSPHIENPPIPSPTPAASPTKPPFPALINTAAPHAPTAASSPPMAGAAAAVPPTDPLPAAVVDNPTPPPSRPFSQFPLLLSNPAPPTSASTHSCTKSISCITDNGRIHQNIRSHASFYGLGEGAGSSIDMKIGVNDVDDEHQYEFADQNHKEHRAISNQVQALNGNRKYANNHYHLNEAGAEDDEFMHDPELMYGLRQNPKRSRRFADQLDAASSEEDANMAMRGNDVDYHDANLIAAETRPANVSYKKSMFTKLQEKKPAACTECGREFSSWKALFGHMRCHPEREWRGIQPPAEYSSMRAPSKGKSNSNGENKRYIVVKPLQTAIKHCSQRRTEHIKHFKPCKSPPNDTDMAIKLASEEDDSLLDCFKDNHELQWSACRTQVMLEEEDESETESIEATYMNNKADGQQDSKPLQLSTSLPRGKRSKRSHFTVKSLRSVQDQLAAHEISLDEKSQPAKKEDLEMATCLVMLALAGSDTELEKQEAEAAALLKEEAILVDANDDDEGSIGSQLRLTWSQNDVCAGATGPRALDGITNIGSRDDTFLNIIGEGEGGKYECTACKRIFKSHQALGGHRASHKKVKGCFAKTTGDATEANSPLYHREGIATFLGGTSMLSLAGSCSKDQSAAASYAPIEPLAVPDQLHRAGNGKDIISSGPDTKNAVVEGSGIITSSTLSAAESGHLHLLLNGMDVAAHASRSSSKLALHNNSSKYHQCSICQRVFSSGQALGGHKRCHWAADKTAAGIAERSSLISHVRPDMVVAAGSTGRTSLSAMAACVAAPAAKLSFFGRSLTPEEATTHQVKVLGIDLNLPAPHEYQESADDVISKPNYDRRAASQLGSLLSLGQCSSVTIHDAPNIPGFADEDALHRASDHASAALSVSSSPSSTTSNIPISESGPC
ncbi:hypothetical protein GOP47_0009847 [Adiantum capillus-veneris]|uniref:C2H2-type domain-containing protein n=1 Tax=Adiantum capillus-veneris TaxID=13818 RepID=A0A9D4UXM0_ADICA|nr:hypothetical protein GOP47_0009847 [Adiantum capillus-veneris]